MNEIHLQNLREKMVYRGCIDEGLENCTKLIDAGLVRENIMEGFVLAAQVFRTQYPGPMSAPLPRWMKERGVER